MGRTRLEDGSSFGDAVVRIIAGYAVDELECFLVRHVRQVASFEVVLQHGLCPLKAAFFFSVVAFKFGDLEMRFHVLIP